MVSVTCPTTSLSEMMVFSTWCQSPAGDRHPVENTIISLREVVGQVTDTMWKTSSFHYERWLGR
jgi:hypothetical protein